MIDHPIIRFLIDAQLPPSPARLMGDHEHVDDIGMLDPDGSSVSDHALQNSPLIVTKYISKHVVSAFSFFFFGIGLRIATICGQRTNMGIDDRDYMRRKPEGAVVAQGIINKRPFAEINDLLDVRGIGKSNLLTIRQHVYIHKG